MEKVSRQFILVLQGKGGHFAFYLGLAHAVTMPNLRVSRNRNVAFALRPPSAMLPVTLS